MKKILISIIAVMLMFACIGSFAACDNAPSEKLIGFDTELAEALAKELGLKIKFVEIDWDSKEAMLESGALDLVWNGFTYTVERDNGYIDPERDNKQIGGLDFSNYYMENKQVAVIDKAGENLYTSNASFAGKKGCAEASSAGEKVVNEVLGVECAQLQKQLDVFTGVASGTYDFGVIDLTMASEYILAENAAYKNTLAVVELQDVEVEYYAVACREGSNMKGVLNYALAKLFKNNTAEDLAKKYNLSGNLYNGFADVDVDNYTLPTDGDFAKIKNNGTIVVGYTIFAPMNYMAE